MSRLLSLVGWFAIVVSLLLFSADEARADEPTVHCEDSYSSCNGYCITANAACNSGTTFNCLCKINIG